MKQKQLELGGAGCHIEVNKNLLKENDVTIDRYCLLLLEYFQNNCQNVANKYHFIFSNEPWDTSLLK